MKPSIVLVLSSDILVAALLGALLESEGYQPAFANPGESPRDALARLRPQVVMLDCESTEHCTEACFGPAMMRGVSVIIYGPASARPLMENIRARFAVTMLVLPVTAGAMRETIERAIGAE